MSEKEDLLNNLKIDRSQEGESEPFPTKIVSIIAAFVLVLLVGGWFFFYEEDIQEVTTFTVKSVNASGSSASSILDASGYVVARRKATVSSKITGKVLEVFIEEGMYVEEGQLLAQLDDRTYKADLEYAESQLKQAQIAFKSTSALIEGKYASPNELETREAIMEGAQALVNLSKQRVDDMKILAPFSGVVVYKAAQPGEMISPISAGGGFTATGICTIVDMDSLEIEVDVNESFINRVESGQPVVANLNAYPKWDIPSEVIAIIPTADRNKATVRVRIRFLEKDERVLPDMGIRVSFLQKMAETTTEKKEGVVVPNAAVLSQGDNSYVMLVRNGRIEVKLVEVAEETPNYSRIIKGVRAGDQVVASYDQDLENNQKVSIN
ncbi:MAG TPA: efflux RND transporter periplasmic adaptor subunit [Gammaproteobacteria bacterium]|nr:efflux RND transporter periplasmic adaptor subunit [Gammaproteobacteria bacterium]